jgi:hypothetical protein
MQDSASHDYNNKPKHISEMFNQQRGDFGRPAAPTNGAAGTAASKSLYTLVIHKLCEKFAIKTPLDKLVFSLIENMSRIMPLCLYKPDKIAVLTGGTVEEVEDILSKLANRNIIEKGVLGTTKGWRLTAEVRMSAKEYKSEIDRSSRR